MLVRLAGISRHCGRGQATVDQFIQLMRKQNSRRCLKFLFLFGKVENDKRYIPGPITQQKPLGCGKLRKQEVQIQILVDMV